MAENKTNIFAKMVKYFKEVKGEMKKVVWPTWSQTVNNTLIVIAFILIIGVFLGIVDFIFSGAVRGWLLDSPLQAFKEVLGIY